MNEERSFPFDFCNVPRSKEFMLKMKLCKKPCVVWVQCDSPQPVRMECLTTKLWKLVSHRVFPRACISFSYKLHKNVPWYLSWQCCWGHLKPPTQRVSSKSFPWNSSEEQTLGSGNTPWVWTFPKSVTTKNSLYLLLVQNLKCKLSG